MKKQSELRENPMVSILREEKLRSERTVRAFELEMEKLPKGSLQKKTRGEKEYLYLAYRAPDGKVVYQYIRKKDVEQYREAIEKRDCLKKSVESLKYGIKVLDKALRGE